MYANLEAARVPTARVSTDAPAQLKVLVSDLFPVAGTSRVLNTLGWLLAVAVHAGTFAFALQRPSAPQAARPPVEVEIVQPPEPPPPVPEPEAERPAAQALARPAPARAAASPPPAAARAGALHTAKADAPSANAEELLDFTHDPQVKGFGGGVVAVGGTAAFGEKGAAPAPSQAPAGVGPAPRASGEALTAAADLGRKPSLGEADPCRGYFPRDASDDAATASVLVVISKSGAVSKVSLLSETPRSQGFGAAARACMQSKRFTPALDRDGRPTATAIRVNVRFTR